MKEYYNEGLLPDEFVNEAFKELINIKRGTVGEAFDKVSTYMADTYLDSDLYDYVFELEGYINEILHNTTQPIPLREALRRAAKEYLTDMFQLNIYTYLVNHLTAFLIEEQKLTSAEVAKIDLLFFLGIGVDKSTNLTKLRKEMRRYLKKLPR